MTSQNDINHVFAAKVREFRQKIGISQEELADRSGLHRTYISDIERAARNVTLRSASRIADALNEPLARLLETES